jgi:hypothetical protein
VYGLILHKAKLLDGMDIYYYLNMAATLYAIQSARCAKSIKKNVCKKLYLLQPFHEIFDEITEFLFGFFIVNFTLLIKANVFAVPL